MDVLARRRAPILVAMLCMLGVPASAQGPSAPPGSGVPDDMCLVSLAELNELSGLDFVSVAGGPTNCTYDSDPDEDLYTIDLRVELADPLAAQPLEDGLWLVRVDEEEGHEVTVGGLPAWVSPNGLWVDIGADVFVAQPILFFMTDPPDPEAFLPGVGELAVSRLHGAPGSSEAAG